MPMTKVPKNNLYAKYVVFYGPQYVGLNFASRSVSCYSNLFRVTFWKCRL